MASDPQFIRIPRAPSVRLSADRSVTADPATDRLTLSAHGFAAGDEVRLVGGTTPGGLALNTTYVVVNPSLNDFQLSTVAGGAAIDITSAGSGLLLRPLNTRLDGSGHAPTLIAAPTGAGALGLRIDLLRVQAIGSTTAGMVRLFRADAGGSRLLHELPVTAATPTASVRAFAADVQFVGGLLLEPGQSLRVATHQAEAFDVTVLQGGEF